MYSGFPFQDNFCADTHLLLLSFNRIDRAIPAGRAAAPWISFDFSSCQIRLAD